MKKTLMIAAALTMGTAALAQTSATSEGATVSGGYPPCSRTVTDRCIQLYERGVATSANLAMNDSMSTSAAVGGPYEPVTTHSEMTTAAVGGPIEERTGYPPCDPGPGDDRCIQRYERGVTGAGN